MTDTHGNDVPLSDADSLELDVQALTKVIHFASAEAERRGMTREDRTALTRVGWLLDELKHELGQARNDERL